jgi:hypothetical protein
MMGSDHERCGYCDGTGDVTSITGEWRGECTECRSAAELWPAWAEKRAWADYSKAWPEAMCGYEFYRADELAEARERGIAIARCLRIE